MAPLDRLHMASQPIFLCDSATPSLDSEEEEGFVQVRSKARNVTFSHSVKVYHVENKKQYPEEHKSQIWYKKKDFTRFRDSCRRIVEWVSASRSIFSFVPDSDEDEQSHFCSRGLERYSQEGSMRYAERLNSMRNDLYLLSRTGARPEEISELMGMHSAICGAEARERAREDSQAAKRHHGQHQHLFRNKGHINGDKKGNDSFTTSRGRQILHRRRQYAVPRYYQ
jgi:hypothetical protein